MELLKPSSVVIKNSANSESTNKSNITKGDLTAANKTTAITGSQPIDVNQVRLSRPSPEQLLADKLLLDSSSPITITTYEQVQIDVNELQNPFYIQQQYVNNVNGSITQINSGKDTEDLFNKVQTALEHSQTTHKQITDIFSSLGQLDKETKSYLVASEYYIENNLQSNLADGAPLIEFPSPRDSKISYVIETLEGDTISVSYRTNASFGDESGFNGLLYQVDGDLSEEEHEALNKLFMGTSEYVGQVSTGIKNGSAFENIDIAENFDMSLLKGFKIETSGFMQQTSFNYQVNDQTQEQTLAVEMGLGIHAFNFNLTTSLLGSKDEEEVSRYALEMKDLLEEFGLRKGEHELLHEFIVDSFTSLFDVNTQKGEHGIESLSIPLIGKRVGANQFTSKISTLMDYTYSLNIAEAVDFPDEVSTRIRMSQETESQRHGQMYELNQKKSFYLHSYVSTPSSQPEIGKDVVITTRTEELENNVKLDGLQKALSFISKHNLDNRVEDSRYYRDGSSETLVTEESIVELSELKLVEDILTNLYVSSREIKQEESEKEEDDGASIVTGKSKALDVYIQYDKLKLN